MRFLRKTSSPSARRAAILSGFLLFCNSPANAQVATKEPRPAAHFLDQATFGPKAGDVAAIEASSIDAWIDAQFATPESAWPEGLDTGGVRNQLFLNMANGADQLRQRTLFALSQTIVISTNKTASGAELIPWMRLLSRNAFGNYRTLLREVTLSPTMGKYLDLVFSRRATATSSPNENFARELMQLFSIGLWDLNQDGTAKLDGSGQPIPSYNQDRIKEVARALTGWTYPTRPGATPSNSNPEYFEGELLPRVTTHDTGAKTLFFGVVLPPNQTTSQDMEAVIDNIFNHPNVGPFIATRLIRSLVTSNPSPAYIRRVADAFANNGAGVRGDMKAVLRALLTDPEAAAFQAEDGRLKDPVLHVIGLGRALGATITGLGSVDGVLNNLTQRLLTPQTVFSFYSPLNALPDHTDLFGPEFQIYPPALALQRANYTYGLLNNSYSSSFNVDLAPFIAVAADATALVNRVNERLLFGRMTPELAELITVATNALPYSASSARERALGALYLAAISSEYSVYNDGRVGSRTVQPPTGLVATAVNGGSVTLQWKPPLIGPAPAAYVLEGGTQPGEALVSLPTGGGSPTVSVAVPPGVYYFRIHTIANGVKSRASSEIRVHVDVPAGPTAPANLLGAVNGTNLALSWRNTYGGGAPSSIVLDVTGPVTTALTLGVTDTFTFSGVPPGQYTFTVRAVNAAGSSGSSNPLTLTFPTTCSGAPQTPINFFVAVNGNNVSANWWPAATGAAVTRYEVNVTGTMTARLPVVGRTIGGAVPPGTYNVSVRAANACGNSAYTAVRTVTVR